MEHLLSSSGARIRGDDYQHLIGWTQMLRALQPGSGIESIGIEDPEAGSADDVTVYNADGTADWYQAKSAVDAREPATIDWLMAPSRNQGASILQRLFQTWASRSAGSTRIIFLTNRQLDPSDTVLSLRDGRDGTVAARLRTGRPQSKAGRARARLAAHLGVPEDQLLGFLSAVSFRLGKLHDELSAEALPLMYTCGLRHDAAAVDLGITLVRQFVTAGRRRLSLDEIRTAVVPLARPGETPTTSILIQAIDRDPAPENATIALDWLDQFTGDEPRTRRWVRDRGLWDGRFRDEIRAVVQRLRQLQQARVMVRGYMRLPTWFAVGVQLSRTAGFEVVSLQNGTPWSSWGDTAPFLIRAHPPIQLAGNGNEIALGISLATDLSQDVEAYARRSLAGVSQVISITPQAVPRNDVIANAAQARDCAYRVRDAVRTLVREHDIRKIHLFLATPASASLLLGHLWDRMPFTQLYEDLGAGRGYAPSYTLSN
jgi:hypothetical protein